jgi:SCY1-like protein 1
VVKTGWESIKRNPVAAVDAYNFGILIYEVFNGAYLATDQLSQPKSVPPTMQQSYKRLINANPKARISVSQFLEQGQRSGGFFETPLIHLTNGIENLGLKSESEREEFLRSVITQPIIDCSADISDRLPQKIVNGSIFPQLVRCCFRMQYPTFHLTQSM